MFQDFEACHRRPEPFEFSTARELWTGERFDLILRITCDCCALSAKHRQDILARCLRAFKPGGPFDPTASESAVLAGKPGC